MSSRPKTNPERHARTTPSSLARPAQIGMAVLVEQGVCQLADSSDRHAVGRVPGIDFVERPFAALNGVLGMGHKIESSS